MPYTKLKVSSFLIVMQWLFIITNTTDKYFMHKKFVFFSLKFKVRYNIISEFFLSTRNCVHKLKAHDK